MITAFLLVLAMPTGDDTLNRCLDSGEAAQGVTFAIRDCVDDAITRSDDKLNRAYRVKLAGLAPSRRQVLRRSERAWITKKERACLAKMTRDSGQDGILEAAWCALRWTDARTDYLRHFK